MTSLADILMVLLSAVMLVLVGVALASVARRSGRDAASGRRLGLSVSAALALWLAATAALAEAKLLAVWNAVPPRWPLLPLAAFVVIALVSRMHGAKGLRDNLPCSWPVAAQSFRVGVELAIYALYTEGRAPRQVTFEGRNFDILVGLTAPLVAWLLARQRATPLLAVGWNLLGLCVLANTVATVVTSVPGPLHLAWEGAPLTAIASWPVVWLPAFLMPLAVFLHVTSLQQLSGRRA